MENTGLKNTNEALDRWLNGPGEIEQIDQSVLHYIRDHYLIYLILIGVFFVAMLILTVLTSNTAYLQPLIIIFSVTAWLFHSAYKKVKHQFMMEFARSIGFGYTLAGDLATIKGKFCSEGRSRYIEDVIFGNFDEHPVRIFTYGYTIGHGKHARHYAFTVFEATFKSKMPNITLRQESSFLGLEFFNNDDNLKLEGDFNKHFDLYVPRNYEREAYELFTPDRMAVLIDKAKHLNFEFIDDKLYIYVTKVITSKKEMGEVFTLVDYLINLFEEPIQDIRL